MKKKVNPELNSESPRTSRQSQSLHSELKSEKRELAKLHDVPHCIKPDVSYHLGYLSGYTESASFWSFFTQWSEVLLRLDGSSLPRCVIEIFIATTLGLLAAVFTDPRLEWTPRVDCSDVQRQKYGADMCDDGLPLLHEFTKESSSTGHALLGGLLGFLTVFRSQIAWTMYLNGYTACIQLRTASMNLARCTIGPLLATA